MRVFLGTAADVYLILGCYVAWKTEMKERITDAMLACLTVAVLIATVAWSIFG